MVTPRGRSIVVSIGINIYEDPSIPSLRHAVDDAQAFHDRILVGRDEDRTETVLLLDEDASVRTIRRVLGDWLASSTPKDNIVIYYAGHGGRELNPPFDSGQPDAFLIPADAELASLYSSAISLSHELPRLLDRLEARHVTCILDCCLSGTGRTPRGEHGVRNRGIDGPNVRRNELLTGHTLRSAVPLVGGGSAMVGEGVSILSACGPNQLALESDELGHGFFTHALLDVIDAEAAVGNTTIGIGPLYQRAAAIVKERSAYAQIPMLEGRISEQALHVGAPDELE